MILTLFYTPPAMKLGGYTGITMSVRLCVDAWLGKMVQSNNCFPFTPIIMKHHIQTPDESRMWPSDFGVKKSKGQGHNALIIENGKVR